MLGLQLRQYQVAGIMVRATFTAEAGLDLDVELLLLPGRNMDHP